MPASCIDEAERLYRKALRLAGAHAAAFASGRTTVLADPDPWIGCEQGGGWGCYFEPVSPCNLTALGLSPAESATVEAVWGSSGWRPSSGSTPTGIGGWRLPAWSRTGSPSAAPASEARMATAE